MEFGNIVHYKEFVCQIEEMRVFWREKFSNWQISFVFQYIYCSISHVNAILRIGNLHIYRVVCDSSNSFWKTSFIEFVCSVLIENGFTILSYNGGRSKSHQIEQTPIYIPEAFKYAIFLHSSLSQLDAHVLMLDYAAI